MTTAKRKVLGRGLGALLPPTSHAPAPLRPPSTSKKTHPGFFDVGIEEIYPNPEQPRHRFADDELEELARSVEELGIIQPLIVRERGDGGFFLIAGERRWRAAQRAGLDVVPVVVQDVSDREAFERAIVENVQRADLNPIEEAEAFSRLITEYDYTQETVAKRVGKERSTIANALRLLKLPLKVRALVEENELTMGHARALLALGSPDDIEVCARQVIARGLSVRATEALVKDRASRGTTEKSRPRAQKSASVRDVETRLTKSLGAQVALREDRAGKGGRIEVRYANLDDLDRLLAKLLRR